MLQAGLTRTLNMLGRKSKALKEGEANLAGDHIREGLTCIIAVKVCWGCATSCSKHFLTALHPQGTVLVAGVRILACWRWFSF